MIAADGVVISREQETATAVALSALRPVVELIAGLICPGVALDALLTCYCNLALRELGPTETAACVGRLPGLLRKLVEATLEAQGSA